MRDTAISQNVQSLGLSDRLTVLIRSIPPGRVATYGQIAALAGNPRGARQVARLLHSRGESHQLPWHRVINSHGMISLPRGSGFELQRALLLDEGVSVDSAGRVDLQVYGT